MAKIALITEKITPALLQWADGLQQQRHTVRILTSRNAQWTQRSEIPIQQYFKKWSLLESVRLLPSLTQDMPDIFHFVFQTEEESTKAAHWGLFSFAQSLRRPVISSLLARPGKQWRWNPFLRWSDGVSFETKESLMRAKRIGLLDRHQKTEILLPVVTSESLCDETQFHQLQKSLGKYIFIAGAPSREKLDLLQEALVGSEIRPVFWGPRSKNKHRLEYTALSEGGSQLIESLVSTSTGLFLCFHDFSPSELLQWKTLSLRYSIPIWIREEQLEAVPGLCRHGKTGYVLKANASDLRKLLLNTTSAFEFDHATKQNYAVEMADQTLNLLNRFYSHFLNS